MDGRTDRRRGLPGRRRPAQPAVPGARAGRGGADGRLPLRQAVHELPARHPGHRAGHGADRGLARGDRGVGLAAGGARPRGRGVDRRLRPDLRLPGRGRRPGARREVGAGPLRHPGRAARRPDLPRRHHGPAGLVRGRGPRGRLLVDGARGGRRCLPLRALHRQAARPEPAQPGLLHRQRRDRHHALRLRPARPAGARPRHLRRRGRAGGFPSGAVRRPCCP
ncbi:hypothetical protein SBRY_10059 [Actinacidiphila bryophytorum]|uniref:Uncharacterized protein n=1 Tax=Actinacidiphila bryophytorum TaxID=1436133 RepID=A0A9W4E5M0_9ACTN|nr:hypothetical protein SBRY_10059 [Actinacidiphila bryophytorum]